MKEPHPSNIGVWIVQAILVIIAAFVIGAMLGAIIYHFSKEFRESNEELGLEQELLNSADDAAHRKERI